MESLGIAGIFLFGSQAQGTATKTSDFDIGVLLKDRHVLDDFLRKQALYDSLYDIVSSQIKKLLNVDIVFLQSADLQLQFHVVRDGRLLYLGDKKIVSDFLEQTMDAYADFAPHRKEFHEAILQRI